MNDNQSSNKNINLEEIKDRIILSDFARSILGIKISKNKTACCHLHKESTPSLHFNDEKRFYYCFGCHKSGDVFSLIQEIKNYSFLESVKFAASSCGFNIDDLFSDYNFLRNSSEIREKKDILYKIMEDICIYFEQKLYEADEKNFDEANEDRSKIEPLSYLYKRKLDNFLIKKFRIGYCPKNIDDLIVLLKNKYNQNINLILDSGIFRKNTSSPYANQKNKGFYSILMNRIIFPIFDKFNRIIAFGGRLFENNENNFYKKAPKYINASDSLIFKKNENLYGENFALVFSKSKNQMILVEGYMDVIMMHKAGFENSVAPLGTSVQESQIKSIWSICDEISCCMDGDIAGYKSMISVLDKSLPIISAEKFINFVFLEKNSDPADFVEQNKIQDLKNIIEKNKRYPSSIILNLALKKYKKITIESIAAIKSFLNSYINKLNDEMIKSEYSLYFNKKIEDISNRINAISEQNTQDINLNQNISKNNQSYFSSSYNDKNKNIFKKNLDIFEEIFLYILYFIDKKICQDILISIKNHRDLILNFFKNNIKLYNILNNCLYEVLNKNSIKINMHDIIDANLKYENIEFSAMIIKIEGDIEKHNEIYENNISKIFEKLVLNKILIINIKKEKKIIEENIMKNNEHSISDFERLYFLKNEEKKLSE
jgi:DNA primase